MLLKAREFTSLMMELVSIENISFFQKFAVAKICIAEMMNLSNVASDLIREKIKIYVHADL